MIETTLFEGVPVARVEGDIDLGNHGQVRQELVRVALDAGPAFVTDINDVGYVDSNGVRALFALAREFAHSRIMWLVVLRADSHLHRMFKITAFDEAVRFVGSVDDAIDIVRREMP